MMYINYPLQKELVINQDNYKEGKINENSPFIIKDVSFGED